MERKKLVREEQGRRIKEAIDRKNEQRKRQNLEELTDLETILTEYLNTKDEDERQEILENNDFSSQKQLEAKIKQLKTKLGLLSSDDVKSEKYSYVAIPDSELTQQQLRIKKLQLAHKMASEKKLAEKQQIEENRQALQRLKIENPEKFKEDLYQKRKDIKEKIKKYKLRKEKEQSLKSKVMIYNQYLEAQNLNEFPDLEKNARLEEEFLKVAALEEEEGSGMEDWENQIGEIEAELREIDSEFEDEDVKHANMFRNGCAVEFGVDQIRSVEILFKPYLVGNDQMGLIELMVHLADMFDVSTRTKILSNVFLSVSQQFST